MAKTVVIDELIVTARVPADLPDKEAAAVRRALLGDAFAGRLRRAIRGAVRAFPELARVRVTVSR
jgi:hypothetical protein